MNRQLKIIMVFLLIAFGASSALAVKTFFPQLNSIIVDNSLSSEREQIISNNTQINISTQKVTNRSDSVNQIKFSPVLDSTFPDISLIDSKGNNLKLSDYKGKVILLEFAAMSCPASQSLAGAHQFGSFGNIQPQPGLGKLARYVWQYTDGTEIGDDDFVVVQVLFYDLNLKPLSLDNLKSWEKHFKLDYDEGVLVALGPNEMLNDHLIQMIPGFFLIDRDFKLKYEVASPARQPLFYSELLPMLPKLLIKG